MNKSVTKVLGNYVDFSAIPDQILHRACQRGTAVHSACAALAVGAYVPVPTHLSGYVVSFKNWFESFVAKTLVIEQRFYDHALGYDGQPDFVFEMITGTINLVDIKTPVTESKTWCAQLAAYKVLVEDNLPIKIDRCMALQLRENGSEAKAIPYDYTVDDFTAFLSALNADRYFK